MNDNFIFILRNSKKKNIIKRYFIKQERDRIFKYEKHCIKTYIIHQFAKYLLL